MVRFPSVPKYVMWWTSTWAYSSLLCRVRSQKTFSSKPPKVIVDPTNTLGPSDPHLLVEEELAK